MLGPNLIQNGSFEAGVDTLWKLARADPAAAASVSAETAAPYSPKIAAKIDIQAASNRQIGIAYQQAGFPIQAGALYRVSIALKSNDLRSVRIRVADAATSQLLGSRNFQIGAGWTVETFDFSSFIGSDFAVFSIDVGESAQPVWVDDVSLARIPPG